MPKVLKPTKRVSLSLLRDGVTFKDAVPNEHQSVDLKIGEFAAKLISDLNTGIAKWTKDVKLLTGTALTSPTSFPGAVLLISGPGGRLWAITWGAGHHYLEGEAIDYAFPSAVIARSAIPDEVRSVTKKILDARARVDRSTQQGGATMRNLGVDGNGEAIGHVEARASIAGITAGADPVIVRAGSSLNLPLAKSGIDLLKDLDALHALLSAPVLPGMEAIEQLVALRPKDPTVKELEALLESAVLSQTDRALAIVWPEERLAPTGVLESIKVDGVGDRKRRSFDTIPDIGQVRKLLSSTAKSDVGDRLKAIKLSVHNEDPPSAGSKVSQSVPLRRWLSYEVKIDDRRFCFYDGDWYRMDDKYLDQIDLRVTEILAEPASIALPDWPLYESEADYNVRAAPLIGGVRVDREMIATPLHSRGGIEACDIYVPDGILIHVKRGRDSSSLSHLLAQALVSTDALARDEYARKAWANKLESLTGSKPKSPDPLEVVLGIGRPTGVTTASLFTFTKVNLVRQHDALRSLGVRVRVVWIPE